MKHLIKSKKCLIKALSKYKTNTWTAGRILEVEPPDNIIFTYMIMTGDLQRRIIKLECSYNKYIVKNMHYIEIKFNKTFLQDKELFLMDASWRLNILSIYLYNATVIMSDIHLRIFFCKICRNTCLKLLS